MYKFAAKNETEKAPLTPIEANWEYFKYLAKHKYEVYNAGRELGAPRLQLLKHDWSKFKPENWSTYRDYWFPQSGVTPKPGSEAHNKFRASAEQHYKTEPHHEHKIGKKFEEIDPNTRLEMVADWYAVSKITSPAPDKFPDVNNWIVEKNMVPFVYKTLHDKAMTKQAQYIPLEYHDRNNLADTTTGLSVGLAQGQIDPREVIKEINSSLRRTDVPLEVKEYLGQVKRQLLFREFAYQALQHQTYKQPAGAVGTNSQQYKDLVQAQTGIPIIDAAVTDLTENGTPHNRARLLLARHAVRTLNIDPTAVSDLYKANLKDYDPVLNTYNIVSASSGATFAEPYYRTSNAFTAGKKLDPTGSYQKKFNQTPKKPSQEELDTISAGNEYWQERWKSGKFDHTDTKLFPTKDKPKGKFFIDTTTHKLPVKGHFGQFYKAYLNNEEQILS